MFPGISIEGDIIYGGQPVGDPNVLVRCDFYSSWIDALMQYPYTGHYLISFPEAGNRTVQLLYNGQLIDTKYVYVPEMGEVTLNFTY